MSYFQILFEYKYEKNVFQKRYNFQFDKFHITQALKILLKMLLKQLIK